MEECLGFLGGVFLECYFKFFLILVQGLSVQFYISYYYFEGNDSNFFFGRFREIISFILNGEGGGGGG